ncbi:MAG: hypothetical protein GX493_12060 [Firmicutes bacterium]|nr:hypothetical protein [Bacillota bacterium]
MDLRTRARELGQAVRETPEYKAVQEARRKVAEHEAARIMWEDFRRREAEYRQAVLAGKATEAQAAEIQRLAEILGYNPYLRELFAAEAALARLVVELQQEILAAAGMGEEKMTAEGPAAG